MLTHINLLLCFCVFQIVASVLQLGFITLFLSDALVSSYTCAASFVIFTSQIRFLLGLDPNDSKVDTGLFDTPRVSYNESKKFFLTEILLKSIVAYVCV